MNSSTSTKLVDFLSNYWLPIGYVVLLTGLFWLPERSLYSKIYYACIAAPALCILLSSAKNIKQLLHEPIIIFFILFSTWLIISIYWSTNDQSPSALAKRPLYAFMLFTACAAMALSRGAWSLSRTLFFASLIASLAALYNLHLHFKPPAPERLVGSGSLLNPLLTSHVLGLFSAYWLAHWICTRTHQVLAFACGLVLLAALIATGSRTPLFALAATTLWLTFLCRTRRSAAPLVALCAGAIGALVLAPDIFTERGLSYRPEIWSEALRQFLEAPWIGHGYGSPLTIPIHSINTSFADPHNVPLAVALELGIIGLLFWILMHISALVSCIRSRANAEFSIASALLIYGLVAGMTEGSNFLSRPNESWFLTWIPLTLIAGLGIQKRQTALCEN